MAAKEIKYGAKTREKMMKGADILGEWGTLLMDVPNVVYTCGAIFHNSDLVIPYGM